MKTVPKRRKPAAATQDGFDSIESVIEDIRAGRIVVVVDDEDRENEGDLIMAAEKVTPQAVNFMVKFGRGLICVPITVERAEQLGLQRMVADNRESQKTDFTVSVDAARGVTTGISAADRAAAIRILADPTTKPSDLVQPGHIFSPPSPASAPPACFARSSTTMAPWRVSRSFSASAASTG